MIGDHWRQCMRALCGWPAKYRVTYRVSPKITVSVNVCRWHRAGLVRQVGPAVTGKIR